MAEERKAQRRDRKDAWYIGGLDPMHQFMPYLLPQRTDNEAVLTEVFELAKLNEYVDKKNAENPEFKYTFFHAMVAAIAKTIALRPRMNWFITGRRYYERREISFCFVVKREFRDDADEALAIVSVDKDSEVSPMEQVYGKVKKFVTAVRKEGMVDETTDIMGSLVKMPRPLVNFFVRLINSLDYHGRLPAILLDNDPYHRTVFLANLGSIKMNADYHHLTNWGTNSIFIVIGEKGPAPFYLPDGTTEMREALKMSFTIDERIADGSYFAKSVRIIHKLLDNPELLDRPANDPLADIEFD